ncbi:hypothetical protein LTR62_000740 [Meristemomyces frigidus]|uniref:Uncharacterized protein n=1 Tax=Meristemomyces frigidus TaxID=1508187 RepID=A0AAN7YC69_9PEZI|nr:hypothetical protein LTR62_000740 [Meristemomyces frigidus]
MSTNTTPPPAWLPEETTHQIPWPLLLSALLAFSLNTMLQPSGRVCGAPPVLGFMLRSSPVVCLLDTGYMLGQLAMYYLNPVPGSSAHQRLLRVRYQAGDDGAEEKVDSLLKVQESQLVRLVVFAFSLRDMIKLYGYRGIPWTQAIASSYLVSFLVVEVLVLWPRARKQGTTGQVGTEKREKMIRSSGLLSLSYTSVALGAAFMAWFGAATLREVLRQPHGTMPKHVGIVLFAPWTPAVLFCYAMCAIDRTGWRDILMPMPLLGLMLGIPWIYYVFGAKITARIHRPLLVQAVTVALAVAWVLVGVAYASAVTSGIRKDAKEKPRIAKHRRYIEKVLAWYFMILHFLTAVLYLCFSYDPVGTFVPEWTNYL